MGGAARCELCESRKSALIVRGSLRSVARLRNIIVGALGCAIVACVVSRVRIRLHSLDKIRGNLWNGQLR